MPPPTVSAFTPYTRNTVDKLTVIQDYMAENPRASKREVMRRFAVNQVQLKTWETDGLLKFVRPKPCAVFNHKGRL